MKILILCVSAVVSYLIGGWNPAITMSKIFYHEDIREKGSGNPGFTNFKRVYGMSPIAVSVMLLDILKAMVPVFVTALLLHNCCDTQAVRAAVSGTVETAVGNSWVYWQIGAQFAGFCAMVGHAFPVWYGFRGGKAFMAGFGTIWFVDWRMALIATAVFLLCLFTVKYVSVSSCIASASCPIILGVLSLWTPWGAYSAWTFVMCVLASLLVIARHYPNFVKLRNHTESKFSLSGRK